MPGTVGGQREARPCCPEALQSDSKPGHLLSKALMEEGRGSGTREDHLAHLTPAWPCADPLAAPCTLSAHLGLARSRWRLREASLPLGRAPSIPSPPGMSCWRPPFLSASFAWHTGYVHSYPIT